MKPIEEYLKEITNRQIEIILKLDKLIPEIRDISKHLAEANKGKKPRKQPRKKGIVGTLYS